MSQEHSNGSNLIRKYRPESLSQLRGQPDAVKSLRSFVGSPASQAFVFSGATGVGKTAAAWALASELGCAIDQHELGGIYEIPSGQQNGAAVEDLYRGLALRPLFGSGWKVAIINEADRMTQAAETIWLDVLERLPAKTVIVFTTNEMQRLTSRLVSRCEWIAFDSSSLVFRRGMNALVRSIWKAETGEQLGKLPKNLGRFELAGEDLSIRVALQQIAPYIRRREPMPDSLDVPFIRSQDDFLARSAAARKAWDTRRNGNGRKRD